MTVDRVIEIATERKNTVLNPATTVSEWWANQKAPEVVPETVLIHGGNITHTKHWPCKSMLGLGYGRGVYTSGWLYFYFKGEQRSATRCASSYQRKDTMSKKLRCVKNLKGAKWFKWVPDIS